MIELDILEESSVTGRSDQDTPQSACQDEGSSFDIAALIGDDPYEYDEDIPPLEEDRTAHLHLNLSSSPPQRFFHGPAYNQPTTPIFLLASPAEPCIYPLSIFTFFSLHCFYHQNYVLICLH